MNNSNSSQAFYLEAKKSLGQNFLKDDNVIANIVQSIEFCAKNNPSHFLIHEIGPGSGAITKPLCEKNFHIVGLEKDMRALEGLEQTLQKSHQNQLTLIETDILKFNVEEFFENPHWAKNKGNTLCFGNIPYYITSDILFWFCRNKKHYTQGLFMMQNEVADRLQAKSGTKDYSRLSVKMQLNFEIEKLFVVPAASFVPKPKVNSAIVKLVPKPFAFDSAEKEKSFETFCATLFSARRKMLRRVLNSFLQEKSEAEREIFWNKLKEFSVYEETRPDAISPEAILKLYQVVFS